MHIHKEHIYNSLLKLNQCARELETLKLTFMSNYVVRDKTVVVEREIIVLFYHEKNQTISSICLHYKIKSKSSHSMPKNSRLNNRVSVAQKFHHIVKIEGFIK